MENLNFFSRFFWLNFVKYVSLNSFPIVFQKTSLFPTYIQQKSLEFAEDEIRAMAHYWRTLGALLARFSTRDFYFLSSIFQPILVNFRPFFLIFLLIYWFLLSSLINQSFFQAIHWIRRQYEQKVSDFQIFLKICCYFQHPHVPRPWRWRSPIGQRWLRSRHWTWSATGVLRWKVGKNWKFRNFLKKKLKLIVLPEKKEL